MRRKQLFNIILFISICMLLINSGCDDLNRPKIDNTQPKSKTLPPVLEFEEISVDFGKIGPATVVKKELKFKNSGKGNLDITEIIQCCGVSASADKKNMQYEPNETGILNVQLLAPGQIGAFEKEIKVYSNDPNNPKIFIKVTAEIMQKVFWEPETFNLLLDEENAACPDVKIHSIDGKEFAITGIRSTGNCITADYNPTIKSTEHVLDLKVDMDKLTEQTDGELNVLMNHPEADIATIFFKVVQKYQLKPANFVLRNLKEVDSRKETINIISNYKEDFEIESTSSEKNTVKMIDYKKVENGYEMNVEITPPSDLQNKNRVVDIFYINIKDGKQLAIQFYEYYQD